MDSRHQGDVETGSFGHDSSPVADLDRTVTFGEHRGQRPVVGQGEPKAQEMTTAVTVWPVAKPRPVVQIRVIVHELHVAAAEAHAEVEPWVAGNLVKEVQCFNECLGKCRHVIEADSTLDILSLI